MAIKIEMLRCYSVVAQVGNLSEAALRLGRTQSAVSMTLKQLEAHLGQRLFEGERKNHLTAFGQQVFELSQIQLRQFDDTVKTIEASARAPQGLIRIASIPSVAGLVFPSAIRTMARKYPEVQIELRDTDTQSVIDAILWGQADLGVVSGNHALNGVQSLPLFEDAFGLICSPDHPLATSPESPDISHVMTSGFVMNALCNQIQTPQFRAAISGCNITVHNTLSLISMVHARNWVTVLPQSVAFLAPQNLCFRRIAGLRDRRQVSLLLKEGSLFQELARELADLVVQYQWE